MSIKRAFEVALAKYGRKKKELAPALGVKESGLSQILSRDCCTTDQLKAAAEFFGISVVELIKLGELE